MTDENILSVETGERAELISRGFSVLVIDCDSTCLTIVSKMLQVFGYKVMTATRAADALSILREREDELDLILTEVHLPDMDKYKLLEKIEDVSCLPVVILSADDSENVMLGSLFKGAEFYLVKPVTVNNIRNLWQFSYIKKREAMIAIDETNSIQGDSSEGDASTAAVGYQSYSNEAVGYQSFSNTEEQNACRGKRKELDEMYKNREEDNDDPTVQKKSKLVWTNEEQNACRGKRKELDEMYKEKEEDNDDPTVQKKSKLVWTNEEQNACRGKIKDLEEMYKEKEEDNDYPTAQKKPKLVWTNELHNRFLQAVRILGTDDAHPKKILQYMNVPGLKKENISSHLQKYRLSLKREQDAIQRTMTQDNIPSSRLQLQRRFLEFLKPQFFTVACQPEFRSHFENDLHSSLSMPSFGSAHFTFSVDSNCNYMSNSQHGQSTRLPGQVYLPYANSIHVGNSITSNGELVSFGREGNYSMDKLVKQRMTLSYVEKSGFESATHDSTFLVNSLQQQQQLQQLHWQQHERFLLPQLSPVPPPPQQEQAEQDIFEAEIGDMNESLDLAKQSAQMFHGRDYDVLWF